MRGPAPSREPGGLRGVGAVTEAGKKPEMDAPAPDESVPLLRTSQCRCLSPMGATPPGREKWEAWAWGGWGGDGVVAASEEHDQTADHG